MTVDIHDIETRLWAAADELRANSRLKASEYSIPVLGLIFLKHADHRFTEAKSELAGKQTSRRTVGKADYQARGVLYLPEEAGFSTLLNLPEGTNIGQAINDAMKAIEEENEDLRGVLPKTYNRLETSTLVEHGDEEGFNFKERLEDLYEELAILNAEAGQLEERIGESIGRLLE